ncbi:signal peptidase II [Clostridium kluyveri]|uniref:signal peptidase II n=1 Tax=Clostridium kluyveri TaxID=1534 RepID=UPI00224768DF|nr:signal peptidase II [Clostridium kluyveri]UZQ48884.1 signal peptidase II [Clostridium kluyveri]
MWWFLIITILIAIDQSIKYISELYLKPINTYPVIKDVFHLTYARNTGAAFSIFQGQQMLLISITSIVIIGLVYWIIRIKDRDTKFLKISLSFIIGGAVGNLIDRIRLNYVIDMYDFNLINYPIFNTADIFVVIGTILMIYVVIAKEKELIF